MIKERNLLFDSYKFTLIVLVVMGHTIAFSEITSAMHLLANFIYSFHMPAFIFISGFFSKNIDKKKFLKSSILFLETYIIMQILYLIVERGELTFNLFIYNSNITWYLLSLIAWRFFILCIKKLPKKFIIPIFAISVVLSFFIGFLPSSFNVFSLFRTFVYFPFFFLGYLIDEEYLIRVRQKKIKYWLLIYIPVAIFFVFIIQKNYLYDILFGNISFHDFNRPLFLLLIMRVFTSLNALILTGIFLFITPEKLPFGLEKLGKHVLVIYLFHVLIIIGISKLFSFGLYINLILYSFISLYICLLLARLKFIYYFMNPITKSISFFKSHCNKKDR